MADFYQDRKMVQLSTAQNLVNDISTNTAKKRVKALEKDYNAQPAGERMADRAQKAREGKTARKNTRIIFREKTERLVMQAKEKGIGNRNP